MSENNTISPFIFIGIFIFVIPVILNIFGSFNLGFLTMIGMATIIIGVLHTIYMNIIGK